MSKKIMWLILLIVLVLGAGCQSDKTNNEGIDKASADDNAKLSSLSIMEGKISPFFIPEITSYSAVVPLSTTSVGITALPQNINAKVSGTGKKTFLTAEAVFEIEVTAVDGTINRYTISVTRGSQESTSNTILTSVFVEYGEAKILLPPDKDFAEIEVENDVSKVKVTAVPLEMKTIVSNDGEYLLKVGENNITIIIEAEGGTKREYTIRIIRKDYLKSNNSFLKSIISDKGVLTPEFSKLIYEYNIDVENDTDKIELSAEAEDLKAVVTGTGIIFLADMKTKCEIRVTAEDGTEAVYTVVITKKEPPKSDNNFLKSLTVTGVTLSPSFSKDVSLYSAEIEESVDSAVINAEAEDINAKIEGVGEKQFINGENKFIIRVTAENLAVRDYTLLINRTAAVTAGTIYNGKTYLGKTTPGTGTSKNIEDANIVINEPDVRDFEADGFFVVNGSIKYTGDLQYSWITVKKTGGSDDERTSYWVNGDFSEKIWLRFGKGNYEINVYKTKIISASAINVLYDGDITSWSYYYKDDWKGVYTFNVTNTRDEDGRFIYPSEYIQSDSPEIYQLAQQKLIEAKMENGTIQQKSKVLHDFVVKYLYYDNDSLEPGKRKKQDALSTLNYKTGVCEGYTSLYNALLRSQGIEAKAVAGEAGGGGHAWTNVYDGSVWKFVDTTWDDPLIGGHNNYVDGSNLRDSYFWLDGNTGLNNDHVWTTDRPERAPGIMDTNDGYRFITAPQGVY